MMTLLLHHAPAGKGQCVPCAGAWMTEKTPGGRLNKKDGLTRYGDSYVKDKMS